MEQETPEKEKGKTDVVEQIRRWLTPGLIALCGLLIKDKLNDFEATVNEFKVQLKGVNQLIIDQAIQKTDLNNLTKRLGELEDNYNEHIKAYGKDEELYRVSERLLKRTSKYKK